MKPTKENRDRAVELLRATGRYDDADQIMNPTREWCKSQIGRLLGKPFAPTVLEAITELIDSLLMHSEDPDHAKRIVDHFMAVVGSCPQPAEIYHRAAGSRSVTVQYDPDCIRRCNGGWHVVVDGGQGGVEKCTCWADRPASNQPWRRGAVREQVAIPGTLVEARRFGVTK